MKRLAILVAIILATPAFAGTLISVERVSGITLNDGDYIDITSTSASGASENCLVCAAEPMLWHITERSAFDDPCAPNHAVSITVRGCGLPSHNIWEVVEVSATCYQLYPTCGEP
jgi:hypothetical protein